MGELLDRIAYWLDEWRDRANVGAVVVIVLAMLVGVGAVITLVTNRDSGTTRLVVPPDLGQLSPSPDLTPTSSPVPSASPSGSPSPSPSGSPKPTPTPATHTTAAPISTGKPSAAGAPKVTITVSGGVTGSPTSFHVHIVDPLGGLAGYVFSVNVNDLSHPRTTTPRNEPGFSSENYDAGEADAFATSCNGSLSKPVDTTLSFSRTFRVPGSYTSAIGVQTRSCSGMGTSDQGVPTLGGTTVTYAVTHYTVGGNLWPNGPQLPVATFSPTRSKLDGPFRDNLGPGPEFRAHDDAVIVSMNVDWGDNSGVQVLSFTPEDNGQGTDGPCSAVKEFGSPINDVVSRPDHTYSSPGDYTLTITVVSASCNGANRQTSVRTVHYSVSS